MAQDEKLKNNLPGNINRINFSIMLVFSERVAPVILASQKQFNFTAITAGSSAFGRGVIPRVAAKLDVSSISDVTEVHSADSFTRTLYAGNAVKKVKSTAPIKLLTFRGTSFEPAKEGGSGAVENGNIENRFIQMRRCEGFCSKNKVPALEAAVLLELE